VHCRQATGGWPGLCHTGVPAAVLCTLYTHAHRLRMFIRAIDRQLAMLAVRSDHMSATEYLSKSWILATLVNCELLQQCIT